MARMKKPSMEIICFGDRDVIATSANPDDNYPDYEFPPGGAPTTPDLPLSIGPSMFSMYGTGSNQDLFGTMQSMMQSHDTEGNSYPTN